MTKFNDAVGGLIRRAWVPVIMPILATAHLIGGAVMLGVPVEQAMGLLTLIFGLVILVFWVRRAYPDSADEREQRARYRGYQPDPAELDAGKPPPTPPNQPSAVFDPGFLLRRGPPPPDVKPPRNGGKP